MITYIIYAGDKLCERNALVLLAKVRYYPDLGSSTIITKKKEKTNQCYMNENVAVKIFQFSQISATMKCQFKVNPQNEDKHGTVKLV